MSGYLTGYVCTCCGFIIIELVPVSPWCPMCAIFGCARGRMERVADAGEVKFLTVTLHLREQPAPAEAAPHLPATD